MNISRTEKYIDLTQEQLPGYLDEVRSDALEHGIPIIRPSVQGLLRFLVRYAKPSNILEIGTAVGFSALLMHEYAPGARITTVENYEPRLIKARENFAKYAAEKPDSCEGDEFGSIHLYGADAEELLPKLDDEAYDLIFLDAAKGQYIVLLPELVRLLKPGGMLVSDNCMQDGDVIESRYAVRRRDRTIHDRMREYLSAVSDHPLLYSAILPMADGVTVSVRR
ncbi:MAG: O-methyltransferase [Lachnospiraceae bacterium]|nr:O-methyltransferase [Lachnospiraceae bacterium]